MLEGDVEVEGKLKRYCSNCHKLQAVELFEGALRTCRAKQLLCKRKRKLKARANTGHHKKGKAGAA